LLGLADSMRRRAHVFRSSLSLLYPCPEAILSPARNFIFLASPEYPLWPGNRPPLLVQFFVKVTTAPQTQARRYYVGSLSFPPPLEIHLSISTLPWAARTTGCVWARKYLDDLEPVERGRLPAPWILCERQRNPSCPSANERQIAQDDDQYRQATANGLDRHTWRAGGMRIRQA